MAARPSLEDKLAALRALRGKNIDSEGMAVVRKAIADRSNMVVAAAAEIVGEASLLELAGDLEAAFGRFLVNPIKDDKLCRAKCEIVRALEKLEHPRSEVFERASVHVQPEPVWGGTEDTAVPLRADSLIALARIDGATALPRLVDALVDPAKDVRASAARAMGGVATDAAGLLLRLKARIGDSEAEVVSECLSGLLAVDPRQNLAIVVEFLEPTTPGRCEAAVDALGRSRVPEALDLLRACWPRCPSLSLRQHVFLAIATLRRADAIDHLVEVVGGDSEKDAVAALSALKIHDHDRRLRERLLSVVVATENRSLRALFDRVFPADE